MKIFQKDVMIAGTAYIAAETEEEAETIFQNTFGKWQDDHFQDGGTIAGDQFETLIEWAKDGDQKATLSPVVTYHGAFPDTASFDVVYDEAE